MRIPRYWSEGAIYHIMGRGVRKLKIFRNENDYEHFILLLGYATSHYSCKIHAYCLMPNHFHLLIETANVNISTIMQHILSNYGKHFNWKWNFRGHVFEDRFKSCLVTDEAYFLEVSRYIHLNPVKANLVSEAKNYRWSSYNTYVSGISDSITTTEKVLAYFDEELAENYDRFIKLRIPEEQEKVLEMDIGEHQ